MYHPSHCLRINWQEVPNASHNVGFSPALETSVYACKSCLVYFARCIKNKSAQDIRGKLFS